MNNQYPKIYFGPMSKNIVDVLIEISEFYPIGFIPSRRQIEYSGGYVNGWTSSQFFKYVKSKNPSIFVCRDHGGRSQGSEKDDGMESIIADSRIGFDIIHVDPWKEFESIEEVAKETVRVIKNCLRENPYVKFEVGTEEAIHKYSPDDLGMFLSLVKGGLGSSFESVVYAVVQFGTAIVGTKNVGVFDKDRALSMVSVCKKYNVLSKEHNGDYLSNEDLSIRFECGLDAINIAPEYGTFETLCLINHLIDNLEMEKLSKFFEICYKSMKWQKWIPYVPSHGKSGKTAFFDFLICKVCGHYNYNNEDVLGWKSENNEIDKIIKNNIMKKVMFTMEYVYE